MTRYSLYIVELEPNSIPYYIAVIGCMIPMHDAPIKTFRSFFEKMVMDTVI